MDELTVKQKITQAMNEPSPPEQLVQRMVIRAKALTVGRWAEERLKAEEGTLPLKERAELAAKGMVGRLASVAALPEGAEPEKLAAQLAEEPRFVRAVESGNVLARLKNGELLRAVTQEEIRRAAPAPERTAPTRGGPGI